MGQKVHPTGFRLGIIKNWNSIWYADSANFSEMLNNDLKVRNYLKQKLAHASVSKIQIDRPAKNAKITIHTARPGIVIGKKGDVKFERLSENVSNHSKSTPPSASARLC